MDSHIYELAKHDLINSNNFLKSIENEYDIIHILKRLDIIIEQNINLKKINMVLYKNIENIKQTLLENNIQVNLDNISLYHDSVEL